MKKNEAFLKKNNCNATLAHVQELAEKKQGGIVPLSDAELDAATGGTTPFTIEELCGE